MKSAPFGAFSCALFACVLAVAGCSSRAEDGPDLTVKPVATERVFTGQVAESDALVGIAIEGDTVRAYLCDGPKAGPVDALTVSTWFEGRLGDEAVALKAGDHKLTARFTGGEAVGEVTFDGETYRFVAPGVTGRADLWSGVTPRPGETRRGKIMLADGTERGSSYPPYGECRLRPPIAPGGPSCW